METLRSEGKRTPRFKRRPEEVGGIKLQRRDIEIIKLVWQYRFLNSEQIQALVTGSNQVILRRLQKLYHHGFLDRPIAQVIYPLIKNQGIVYALGDKGASLIAEKFGVDIETINWRKKNRKVKDQHIQHTLMLSKFRATLTLALENLSDTQLLFWERESKKLRDYVFYMENGKRQKGIIFPDGYFAIGDLKGTMYFFIESDQSTTTNKRFLKKIQAYFYWWRQKKPLKKSEFGFENFRVLTITKSERRKENLRSKIKEADSKQIGSKILFWFTVEQNYNLEEPGSILGPIWQTGRDDEWHSILE